MKFIAFSIILSFITALIAGSLFIPVLRRLGFVQNIREEGPKSHLSKAGTPMMGGIIFLIPICVLPMILARGSLNFTIAAVLVTAGFALIGFIDDFIKIVMKRSLGLRAYQKIFGQVVIAVLFAYFAYNSDHIGSSIIVPFFGLEWDLGMLYIPIMSFIIIGTVNSVNLTDGLDGLASGVTLVVGAAFSLVAYHVASLAYNEGLSYLAVNYENLIMFSAVLTGACLGFLKFNSHPAQIFMGDTGSLGLGGAVAALSVLMRLPLLLPLIGGIYMVESISVILQVLSFKFRGKRIFKMSPLHHHFELSGMTETRVVAMFMIAATVLCLIGLLGI